MGGWCWWLSWYRGWGGAWLDDQIFRISCDSPSYRSLFDLNETTGCRTDAACESDAAAATLHTRRRGEITRRADFSCSVPFCLLDAICERELLRRAVMVPIYN